jgi:cytochrome c oxidase subunit IV
MAALMSTADTLINAASAIFVNDFYRVYVRPSGEDAHYLRIARVSSLCVAGVGLLLVPVLFRNPSVYHAHALFTAIVTPPLVVAVFLALFWRRYNTTAVLATLLGGGILIGLSLVPSVEALVMPWFSFGMGAESFLFMRALFGLCASAVLGTVVTLLTSAPPSSSTRGLVVGEQLTAMRLFKGAEPNFRKGHTFLGTCRTDPALKEGEALMTAAALQVLNAHVGDFVLVSDARWLRGNLRVAHVRVVGTSEGDAVRLSEADALNANLPLPCSVRVEKFI